MSLSGLKYDDGSYAHKLKESIGPGQYQIDLPRNDCDGCFYPDVPIDRYGGSLYPNLVDVDSELIGITRKASDCPANKYIPSNPDNKFGKKQDVKVCKWLVPEHTLISNPKCTGHERGVNRWEWLCKNPQDNALVPFDWWISDRTVTKDNHRPCIPKPLDQCSALPPTCNDDIVYDWSSMWENQNPFPLSVQLPSCQNIRRQ
jgi:hypothetical protein